jgi:hypothetical protein
VAAVAVLGGGSRGGDWSGAGGSGIGAVGGVGPKSGTEDGNAALQNMGMWEKCATGASLASQDPNRTARTRPQAHYSCGESSLSPTSNDLPRKDA